MKYIKFSFFVFLLTITVLTRSFAQDKVLGIIVELSNGQKVEYRLVDHPKLVFDGQTIKLTADGIEVEYTPAEMAKVTTGEVENVSNGIEERISVQGDIKVEAGFVRLSGFAAGDAVTVYSISGVQMAIYQVESDGSLVIPISSLPSGISIINTNKQSIKITRR